MEQPEAELSKKGDKDTSPRFSDDLHGKLTENELNDRVAALTSALGAEFGEKFRASIRELWAHQSYFR